MKKEKGRKLFGMTVLLIFALFYYGFTEDGFRFVVIGSKTPNSNQKIFDDIISEIERLHPDFLIVSGNIIEKSNDEKILEKQWDETLAVFSKLSYPVYFVAGENEVHNEKSRKIFEKKTAKKSYYSFEYKNSLFLILDNTALKSWDNIEKEQKEWLEGTLAQKEKYKNIFCFFHKPFWIKSWETVEIQEDCMHSLLVNNAVEYCFSGHNLTFFQHKWDKVKYYSVGSSGAHISYNEAIGDFYGYVLVTVKNEKVDVALMKYGSIVPQNALSYQSINWLKDIEKIVRINPIEINSKERVTNGKIELKVKNIYESDFEEKISWSGTNSYWKITPFEKKYKFAANSDNEILFQYKILDTEKILPLPFIEFIYPTTEWGKFSVKKNVDIAKFANIAKVNAPPKIDGKLNDEHWVPANSIGMLFKSDIKLDDTIVYAVCDKEHLYLAIKCIEKEMDKLIADCNSHDEGTVSNDDCIFVYIDPSNEKRKIYQLIANSNEIIFDQICTFVYDEIKRDKEWNGKWDLKIGKEKDAWIVEMAIPFNIFGITVVNKIWGFNIARYQARAKSGASWQPNISINPSAYGKLIFK